MDPVTRIAALWGAFIGTHMILSSNRVRPVLVGRLGEALFKALYALIALAIIVVLFSTYLGHKHQGAVLWSLPHEPWLVGLASLVSVLGFILIAAGILTPSPVVAGIPYRGPRGANYISRHCLMMGITAWALSHLVLFGLASDVAFFGGFVVMAVLGSWHQDRRKLASGDATFTAFHAATPFFPFTGKNTVRGLREFSIPAVVAGIVIAVLIRAFHADLFG